MIPLPTTTIAILRPAALDSDGNAADPYDAPVAPQTVATGIRAHIGSSSGSAQREGANRAEVTSQLTADPCDLRSDDLVRDESTGRVYRVDWAAQSNGLGLDHTSAGLIFAS